MRCTGHVETLRSAATRSGSGPASIVRHRVGSRGPDGHARHVALPRPGRAACGPGMQRFGGDSTSNLHRARPGQNQRPGVHPRRPPRAVREQGRLRLPRRLASAAPGDRQQLVAPGGKDVPAQAHRFGVVARQRTWPGSEAADVARVRRQGLAGVRDQHRGAPSTPICCGPHPTSCRPRTGSGRGLRCGAWGSRPRSVTPWRISDRIC